MAKEDFCFTCYHLDAASDISHMNRLERGAYWDVVLQIKKFGWLSLDQIRKFLGKDFDECWPSINLVMIYDETEKRYYLEWLETSIQKSQEHSKHQSKRGKQGGRSKKKPEVNPVDTQSIPEQNQKNSLKGDGNGNGIGDVLIIKKEAVSKNEDLPSFSDYERWSADIINSNDADFEQMIMKERVQTTELAPLVREYLGLIAQYPNKEPPDQHRFRISVLEHIRKNGKAKPQSKQPAKKFTIEDLKQ